jgi:hypothetical protein
MPTLLLQDGFKFFFYANEHLPIHVYVSKGNGFAKINLQDIHVVESYMKPSELKRALELIAVHQADFVRKWNEFFNKW